jgi:hypothetical protein
MMQAAMIPPAAPAEIPVGAGSSSAEAVYPDSDECDTGDSGRGE